MPEDLFDSALDSVTPDRPPHLFMDADAETVKAQIVGAINHGETPAAQTFAPAVNPLELAGLSKQAALGQAKRLQGLSSSGGQPFTSFGPSAINNGTACAGAHPLPEAVSSASFDVAWLKGSFTHDIFPFKMLSVKYFNLCKIITVSGLQSYIIGRSVLNIK